MQIRRSKRSCWASPRAGALGLVAAIVLGAASAHAIEYFSVKSVLKSFFQGSEKVGPRQITLSEATAAELAKRLGVSSIKRDWKIYVGEREGQRTGYAVVDEEKGMHEPIDFAVQFSPAGAVERIEILIYREAYGDEVRGERFRKQFHGKTARDPITVGKDIDIVSGASISSRSIALGVKRDTLILQAALKSGSL